VLRERSAFGKWRLRRPRDSLRYNDDYTAGSIDIHGRLGQTRSASERRKLVRVMPSSSTDIANWGLKRAPRLILGNLPKGRPAFNSVQ